MDHFSKKKYKTEFLKASGHIFINWSIQNLIFYVFLFKNIMLWTLMFISIALRPIALFPTWTEFVYLKDFPAFLLSWWTTDNISALYLRQFYTEKWTRSAGLGKWTVKGYKRESGVVSHNLSVRAGDHTAVDLWGFKASPIYRVSYKPDRDS